MRSFFCGLAAAQLQLSCVQLSCSSAVCLKLHSICLELHSTHTPLKAAARMCLQADGNAELRGHVLKSEIAPHVFVHMTSEELASKVRAYCCCRRCCCRRCCWCCGLEGVVTLCWFCMLARSSPRQPCWHGRELCCAARMPVLLAHLPPGQANLHGFPPTDLVLLCCHPDHATQDLQRWRQNVRQESLRQAVLPPDVAARISTAAAVQMKREG